MYYEIFSMKSSQLAQYLNDWCQKIVHWRQVSMNLRWPSCMTRAKIIEIPNPFLYSRAARKKFSFQYAEADHQPPPASQQPCVLSEACLSFVFVHYLFIFVPIILVTYAAICHLCASAHWSCTAIRAWNEGYPKVHEDFGLVSIVSYSCPSLMIIASGTQFHIYLLWGQRPFSIVS